MNKTATEVWHELSSAEVLRRLDVDARTGLAADEVKQRQEKFGLNRMTARRGKPAWFKFLQQFNQPLVYVLLIAVGFTMFLREWVDASVILGVVIVNAIIGFLQEAKAEKAIDALAKMVSTETAVRRDGRRQRVHSDELVPGDVVLLKSGDRVPADLRLIRLRNLQADESALTGESLPVAKNPGPLPHDTILAERKNCVYAGTFITSGEAEGVVFHIGDHTETGHIARSISTAVEISTPLTRKIAQFSKLILVGIVAIAIVTFVLGVARGEKPAEMFMAAVALAVGAIPEGLPAAVTIVLAIGVSRLAKRKAIIRKLPAVETLGSTTIICTDKTGTLTKNQMTVQEIFAGGKIYSVTGAGYEPEGEFRLGEKTVNVREQPALEECLRAGVLCNESRLARKDGQWRVHGDPTEAAMVVAAEKAGMRRAEMHEASPRHDMIPFESEHMFRATLHKTENGNVIYKVGAVERLLPRCANALDERGDPVSFDPDAVHRAIDEMAGRGLRVLALARRCVDANHHQLDHSHVAEGLTFLGLQGMMDPPRPEAIESVRKCQSAGIAVKMITGDHLVTARAIAKKIGINHFPVGADVRRPKHSAASNGESQSRLMSSSRNELAAISGRELEKISDEQMPDIAERTAVFARVAPDQKLRLVRALQSRNHVVAMTGDGVNDAPALKQADIGVAMGIAGTDVAKGAAAMILTDDNFASIEAAVEEGRGVFDDLTKFIVWIIPTNLGEALMLLSAILLGLPLPLLPLQLLWINLTDTLLGLSLAFEPKENDVMDRPPRDPVRPLLTFPLIMRTGLVSLIMVVGGISTFLWELRVEQAGIIAARTAVINVVVVVQIGYLLACRSLHHSLLNVGLLTNRWAVFGSLAMLSAQLLLTYVPAMNKLFHTIALDGESWLRIVGVAAVVFLAVEFEKWIRFGGNRGKRAIPR